MGSAFLLILFATSVISIKVFSFSSTDKNDQLSSAVLENAASQDLPEKFTVCFAMKHDKIDRRSPFLIRDINKHPWIAPSTWNSGGLSLWFDLGRGEWLKFHVIERPWKFWSHVCAEIDTVTGNISVSMDGRLPLTRKSEKLRAGKPGKLDERLEIGITETSILDGGKRSFNGKVSNIHFHLVDGQNSLETLSRNPCETKGSYLAWSDMTFSRNGPSVFELEEKDEEVCDVLPDLYNVLLPGTMSWTNADHLCKVLSGGMMTGVEDDQDMERLASRVRGTSETCPSLWLPLSDGRKEGIWENTNLNSVAKYLRWANGQPNGLGAQNHAAVDMENFLLGDYHAEDTHCASCTLKSNAILTLRGVCKDSYLGKNILKLFRNIFMNISLICRYNICGHT